MAALLMSLGRLFLRRVAATVKACSPNRSRVWEPHRQNVLKISRLPTGDILHIQKCHQFRVNEKLRTFMDGLLLGCYVTAMSQLLCEANKFLVVYVILCKRVIFRPYFVCLHERIFNCGKVLMSSTFKRVWVPFGV